MLCESKIINKNPKYRIIKYNDEYLMIDIISTWISLFFFLLLIGSSPKDTSKLVEKSLKI